MDIDLLRDGEQFSTFDTHSLLGYYPDESTSLDAHDDSRTGLFEWNMESERELNGDIALIPVSSGFCNMNMSKLSDTSPCKEDFQKIMNDWQQFISLDPGCDEFPVGDLIITPDEIENETTAQQTSPLHEMLNLSNMDTFDISTFLNDEDPVVPQNITVRKPKAPVKKIDLKAQRYIVDEDEDEVDVETISECGENYSPVLQAGDLDSLLEQFEATEIPELPENVIENNSPLLVLNEVHVKKEPVDIIMEDTSVKCKPEIVKIKQEPTDDTGVETVAIKEEFEDAGIVKLKKEQRHDTKNAGKRLKNEVCKVKEERKLINPESKEKKTEQILLSTKQLLKKEKPCTIKTETKTQIPGGRHKNECTPVKTEKHSPQQTTTPQQQHTPSRPLQLKIAQTSRTSAESTTSFPPETSNNEQIIGLLPQELIARIKESGKRKPISVIPPIPNKKRGGPRFQEPGAQLPRNKSIKLVSSESVQLDHDYCTLISSPYLENLKKDSGFESAEEDERPVIRQQPMVKNADGKLMVSLLKVNTILSTESCQKKKLNLEEYKKRREGFLKSPKSSLTCSPMSSTSSSPLPEDENTRLIKHQEKLMKMAKEVLNTTPKSEVKQEAPLAIAPPQPIQIPVDMEKKTLVSIGVNTDFKTPKKLDPLAPVEQLEEIKPLLEKASAKINCNSLITSLIENIPKVIDSCDMHALKDNAQMNKFEHGEDKTIVYLPKNREATKTISVECQTNISLIQQSKQSRYRRRRTSSNSSSSSVSSCGSSRKSRTSTRSSRKRGSSNTSGNSSRSSKSSQSSLSGSSSSTYSSRSSSQSRSRSSSPRYSQKERERLREVEERRVIYVGRVSPSSTRDDLRKRFQKFGPITNISLHTRDHGYLDNYGFVTFANKLDAYEAIEHGNDDPYQPKYDLSFGGRRIFCKTSYSDLDNMRDEVGYFAPRTIENSFDALLREVQEKLRKRKA